MQKLFNDNWQHIIVDEKETNLSFIQRIGWSTNEKINNIGQVDIVC